MSILTLSDVDRFSKVVLQPEFRQILNDLYDDGTLEHHTKVETGEDYTIIMDPARFCDQLISRLTVTLTTRFKTDLTFDADRSILILKKRHEESSGR